MAQNTGGAAQCCTSCTSAEGCAGWVYDNPAAGAAPSFAPAFQIFLVMLCVSAVSLIALRIPSNASAD